jgi:hypothetical protein
MLTTLHPIHMEESVPKAQIRHYTSPRDDHHGGQRQRAEWALIVDATTCSPIQVGFAIGLHILWLAFCLEVGLRRYVVPRHATEWAAGSDSTILRFAGMTLLVILPIILGYLGHPCWAFRGKTAQEAAGAPARRTGHQMSRSGVPDRTTQRIAS